MSISASKANGSSAQAHSTTTSAKRKRSEGTIASTSTPSTSSILRVQQSVQNYWDILKSKDTTPSILDRLNATPRTKPEPSSKRVKLAVPAPPSSAEPIASKVANGSYTSIDDFVTDFNDACSQLEAIVTPQKHSTQWKYAPDDTDQAELVANVRGFRKALKELVLRDAVMRIRGGSPAVTIKKEGGQQTSSRSVLTLFGNAQGHKQLFSSFQQPAGVQVKDEPTVPLRENGLPNGITSTQIATIRPVDAASIAKTRSFREAFGPSAAVPQLALPKIPQPVHATPSNTIIWGSSREQRPERASGYAYQKLTTGQWLGYDGLSADAVVSDAFQPDISTSEESAIDEDALFRSVYSSFAPSRDNTNAVFSDHIKEELWWQKVGRQVFEQSLEPLDIETTSAAVINDEEIAHYKDVVDNFDPALLDAEVEPQVDKKARDDQAILDEISELLESLYSYQRIRNTTNTGSVDTLPPPSELEVETYNTLKMQLALVVGTLPPYVVARLDGKQLEELNISMRMAVEEKNFRGVMEEDAQSRAIKAAALSASLQAASTAGRAAGISTPGVGSRMAPLAAGRASQQYNSTPAATLLRQSSQNNRQPLSGWQTPGQTASATAPRPSYNNQTSYGTQSARPAYNNTNIRGTGQFGTTANRQNTPLANKSNYAPAQNSYQTRTANSNYNSSYANSQAPMTTFNSPQVPAGQYQAARPSYLSGPAQSASPIPNGSRHQTPGGMNGVTVGGASMRDISGTPQPQYGAAA